MNITKEIYRLTSKIYKKLIENKFKNPYKNRGDKKLKKYIHIGYPKAASTALQKAFFGKHNQLYHLGCGAPKNEKIWADHGYIDENINIALEVDLRYRNNFSYNGNKVKSFFDNHFEIAKQNKKVHAVGISNENICFNWHGGIDTTEKAKRLFEIFGEDTSIIILVRNQKNLIESLYKESIRYGYNADFNEYLEYLWTYKDRNFLYDFCFDKVFELYIKYFTNKNVHVFFFEDFRVNSQSVIKSISHALQIDFYNLPVRKEFNPQLNPDELYIKYLINKRFPHTLSKSIYNPSDTHRFSAYYNHELNIEIPFEEYFDFYSRKYLNQLAKELSSKAPKNELVISWNSISGKSILELFSNSNKNFFSISGNMLRKEYIY
jgi:hypothetical protein